MLHATGGEGRDSLPSLSSNGGDECHFGFNGRRRHVSDGARAGTAISGGVARGGRGVDFDGQHLGRLPREFSSFVLKRSKKKHFFVIVVATRAFDLPFVNILYLRALLASFACLLHLLDILACCVLGLLCFALLCFALLCFAWLGLAWLGLAWLGLAWLDLAWLARLACLINISVYFGRSTACFTAG